MPERVPEVTREDHVRGAGDARVTVIQYGDYECPHTRSSVPIVESLADELGLQLVFRHFPLRHEHRNAQRLAEIAEASAAQGKFWEVHDRLMHRDDFDEYTVMDDLRSARIDVDDLENRLETEPIRTHIDTDVRGARAAGVHSTPTFFINGVKHDGSYDANTLRAKVAEAMGAPRG